MFEQILFSYNILPKNKRSLIPKKVNCISRVTAEADMAVEWEAEWEVDMIWVVVAAVMVGVTADMVVVVAAAVMAEVKELYILFYLVKIQYKYKI
jgi:hypothetical protein